MWDSCKPAGPALTGSNAGKSPTCWMAPGAYLPGTGHGEVIYIRRRQTLPWMSDFTGFCQRYPGNTVQLDMTNSTGKTQFKTEQSKYVYLSSHPPLWGQVTWIGGSRRKKGGRGGEQSCSPLPGIQGPSPGSHSFPPTQLCHLCVAL